MTLIFNIGLVANVKPLSQHAQGTHWHEFKLWITRSISPTPEKFCNHFGIDTYRYPNPNNHDFVRPERRPSMEESGSSLNPEDHGFPYAKWPCGVSSGKLTVCYWSHDHLYSGFTHETWWFSIDIWLFTTGPQGKPLFQTQRHSHMDFSHSSQTKWHLRRSRSSCFTPARHMPLKRWARGLMVSTHDVFIGRANHHPR